MILIRYESSLDVVEAIYEEALANSAARPCDQNVSVADQTSVHRPSRCRSSAPCPSRPVVLDVRVLGTSTISVGCRRRVPVLNPQSQISQTTVSPALGSSSASHVDSLRPSSHRGLNLASLSMAERCSATPSRIAVALPAVG